MYQAPRRFLLENIPETQPAFAFRIYFFYFCDVLNHLPFVKCSNVANLFRRLEHSTVLIFRNSLDLAKIPPSLELMLLVCFQGLSKVVCSCWLTIHIQSILPIPVNPLFHTTLRVSSRLWIGNHGVRQLTIRFWPSSTLLQMWASHSTISEYRR